MLWCHHYMIPQLMVFSDWELHTGLYVAAFMVQLINWKSFNWDELVLVCVWEIFWMLGCKWQMRLLYFWVFAVIGCFCFVFTFLTIIAHCSNINNSEVMSPSLSLSVWFSRKRRKLKSFLDLHNPNPENLKVSIFLSMTDYMQQNLRGRELQQ